MKDDKIIDADFEVVSDPRPVEREPSTFEEFMSWNVWGKLTFLALWALFLAGLFWAFVTFR